MIALSMERAELWECDIRVVLDRNFVHTIRLQCCDILYEYRLENWI